VSDWRADTLVDELLPAEVDWQYWVRKYPFAAISLAALGGYLLARSRGPEMIDAISTRAADALSENVNHVIETRTQSV
jgi:hypothetical protein